MNTTFFRRAAAIFALVLPLCSPSAKGQEKLTIGLKVVATNFVQPTVLTDLPGSNGRLLIADQTGLVRVREKDGTLREEPFLDLTSRLCELKQGFDERGILGLALHPKFTQNRKLYVFYSAPRRKEAPADWDHTSHLSEFKAGAGGSAKVDLATERILLQMDKPWFNHNSGRIAFGPDGFLYIGVGDGGNANDEGRGHSPQGNSQDTSNLMGKILRIDIDRGDPYGIPTDNPFVKGGGRAEIYAYGLRNPWGVSFDRGGNRELFVSDVGQTLYEEVNIIVKGGNYGWWLREGLKGFDPKNPKVPPAETPKVGADGKPLIDPILVYKNPNGFRNDPEALGISVTGGYVYRGKAIPELQGRYIFADWSAHWALPKGILFAGTRTRGGGTESWSLSTLTLATHPKGLGEYVVALGEDDAGELYILTNVSNSLIGRAGKVHKLVAP